MLAFRRKGAQVGGGRMVVVLDGSVMVAVVDDGARETTYTFSCMFFNLVVCI